MASRKLVLAPFSSTQYGRGMSDAPERLTLADREDLASALAFALRFGGRKRVHNADEFMGGQKKALKPVHRGTGD